MEVIAGDQPVATVASKLKITCTTNIVSRDGLFEISPIHAEQFCQVRERIATHSEFQNGLHADSPKFLKSGCRGLHKRSSRSPKMNVAAAIPGLLHKAAAFIRKSPTILIDDHSILVDKDDRRGALAPGIDWLR